MKICVGCRDPGGPDAVVIDSLEESHILDYYNLHDDGSFEHTAQTRKCLSGCSDSVRSIVKRGVEGVMVVDLSPGSLPRLRTAQVKVFLTEATSARTSIDLLHKGRLRELGMDQFSKVGRKRKQSV
ncbi:MAG: hypothetical protein ACUVT7_06030 [Thermoplasmata archaeon]